VWEFKKTPGGNSNIKEMKCPVYYQKNWTLQLILHNKKRMRHIIYHR